jgi:hypothetical protein
MPPKRIAVQPARRTQPKGYFGQVYHTLTSEENASVVISVAMFGVGQTPCTHLFRISFIVASIQCWVHEAKVKFVSSTKSSLEVAMSNRDITRLALYK